MDSAGISTDVVAGDGQPNAANRKFATLDEYVHAMGAKRVIRKVLIANNVRPLVRALRARFCMAVYLIISTSAIVSESSAIRAFIHSRRLRTIACTPRPR